MGSNDPPLSPQVIELIRPLLGKVILNAIYLTVGTLTPPPPTQGVSKM